MSTALLGVSFAQETCAHDTCKRHLFHHTDHLFMTSSSVLFWVFFLLAITFYQNRHSIQKPISLNYHIFRSNFSLICCLSAGKGIVWQTLYWFQSNIGPFFFMISQSAAQMKRCRGTFWSCVFAYWIFNRDSVEVGFITVRSVMSGKTRGLSKVTKTP